MTAGHPPASTDWMVTVDDETAVGVPEITPPTDNDSPAGSVPVSTEYVYGPVPPLDVRVALYGEPTDPTGNVAGEMVVTGHTAGAMTMV